MMMHHRVARATVVIAAIAVAAVSFLTTARGSPPAALAAPGMAAAAETTSAEMRDLLDRQGIDESRLKSLVDGRPVNRDEHEALYQILFRVPRIDPEKVHQLHLRGVPWSRVTEDPDSYRGQFFHLSGWVTHVEVDRLIPELVERLDFERYYRVSFRLRDGEDRVLIYARAIPEAWLRTRQPEMNHLSSAYGMFLKIGDTSGTRPELVFAANRIAWHPNHVDPQFGILDDHVLLGALGMDVGLLDQVQDRKRIVHEDRECFYQLLSAVDRFDTDHHPLRPQGIDVPSMLSDPVPSRGRLYSVHGTARRAVRVRVDDPDIRIRFGIDHYYEVDVLVPLKIPLQLIDNRQPSEGRVYNTYPVTVCVRHLPQEMPEGEDIHEPVWIDAFFLKLWAYRTRSRAGSNRVETEDALPGRQAGTVNHVSPLLIGRQVRWVGGEGPSDSPAGLMFGVLFVVALAAIAYGVWRTSRNDRRFEDAIRDRRREPLDLDSVDRPDSTTVDRDA